MISGYYKGVLNYGEEIPQLQNGERPFNLTVLGNSQSGFTGKVWFGKDDDYSDEFRLPYTGMNVTISATDEILVMLNSWTGKDILESKINENSTLPKFSLSIEFVAFLKKDEEDSEYYEGDWVIKEFVKLLGFIPWIKKRKKGKWKMSKIEEV